MNLPAILTRGFNLHIGKLDFSPTYLEAGIIILLLFVLVLTMAQVRRHVLGYSFQGTWSGIVLGFILALVLEGFLLLSGKTIIINLLGWKSAPSPIQTALDAGHGELLKTLGVKAECLTK